MSEISIRPFGAHVTAAGDLLFMSSAAVLDGSKAIRGGVPIIAPWFGTTGGDPQHGWARISEWELDGTRAHLSHDGIELDYEVKDTAAGFRFELTATNTGDARAVQLGFHPYFAVSSVADVRVTGLSGTGVDRVTGADVDVSGEFRFSGLTDVIAPASGTVSIRDAHRTITVGAEGTDATVLWNPGAGADMADLGAGEWDRFVCVEPMWLDGELAAGASHTIAMTVGLD